MVRGPKFCVRRVLNEERFLMECEKSYFKVRLEMLDSDLEDTGGGGDTSEEEEQEKIRIVRDEDSLQ